jgi:hypothetical protein
MQGESITDTVYPIDTKSIFKSNELVPFPAIWGAEDASHTDSTFITDTTSISIPRGISVKSSTGGSRKSTISMNNSILQVRNEGSLRASFVKMKKDTTQLDEVAIIPGIQIEGRELQVNSNTDMDLIPLVKFTSLKELDVTKPMKIASLNFSIPLKGVSLKDINRVDNLKESFHRASSSKELILNHTKTSQTSMRGINESNSTSSRRPVSILSVKQINMLRRQSESKLQSTNELPVVEMPMSVQERSKLDYLEYLKQSQRHDSTNFIHVLESAEEIGKKALSLKVIGTFLLGDKIGKGAFGKVKEGLCTETLQRVAVKILSKQRVKKSQSGIEGVLKYTCI